VLTPPERLDLAGLVLRRERCGDAELVAATVEANLERLRPWMPWASPEAATVQTQRERLVRLERSWDDGTDFTCLLFDDIELSLLGVFGLHGRVEPGGIELGYWLASAAVGKGHATAAARALTHAALERDNIERVEIHCDEANLRSRRVPERLGYRLDRVKDDGIQAPAETGWGMVWVYPS
jgi:RimJ/RimL family protein N-acetyltransferase